MQPDTRAPLEAIHDALGDDLLAVYLYGSAVDGGLRPDSDIDLLVIARTPLAGHARQHLVQRLLELSAYPARDGVRPLELTLVVLDDIRPWRYPPRRDLVFGEWLRPALESGEIAPPALDPDLSVLLTSARQHSRALAGAPADELLPAIPAADLRRAMLDSLPSLIASTGGDERNVLLTLARMWFTLATGRIAPKDQAASWLAERLPAPQRALLDRARQAYLGQCHDDWQPHQRAVEAWVKLARGVIEHLGHSQCDSGHSTPG
ncbi:aminoglycoside adenylyltransferase family protein [Pseudomonas sp. GD03944]|uniref:aminoglycoside adenylyltransferase family protein n=1 Tax=Pseudomonas sp. GD03944 TaxID=2975409 RepID=UPI00244CED6D|nr:aminoglycoside adenylyltransferase family protein [Pseudomonas sp. GD03944]MDH1263343.1 aminoglycoside adenylyltransferase family protein [Pseudomonas sp. GD03944]